MFATHDSIKETALEPFFFQDSNYYTSLKTVVEKTQYNVQSQVPLLPCIEMQFLSVVAGILQTWTHLFPA